MRRHKLYPDEKKAEKRARAGQKPKERITQLVKEVRPCFLFHVDTIIIYWNGLKRYILPAVDHATRLGYARMYRNKNSSSAADFLYRLRYLVDHPVENLQTDNGSEFALEFEIATAKLGIHRNFSRVKKPSVTPVPQPPHPAKEGSVFRRKYQTGTHFARKKDN